MTTGLWKSFLARSNLPVLGRNPSARSRKGPGIGMMTFSSRWWLLLWVCQMALLAPGVEARTPLDLKEIERRSLRGQLESRQSYLQSAELARAIFEKQGGLVKLPADRPTLILPDLHGQRDYLVQALKLSVPGSKPTRSAYQALAAGQLNILLLGDAMHCEHRAANRWLQAERDYLAGRQSMAIEQELVESLGLMQMILDLKVAHPESFYFLRGNHEDMNPASPYRKFTDVGESQLVKYEIVRRFGKDFLSQWHACEKSMPLVAQGGSFVASHAAPDERLTLADLEGRSEKAFRACCWSDNTRWGSAQTRAFLANAELLKVTPQHPWVVGHRKVQGSLYRSQCQGRLLQINPLDSDPRVVLWAPPAGGSLDPVRHVKAL